MTREEAKENLELIKAYAEGGIIQIMRCNGDWEDVETLESNRLYMADYECEGDKEKVIGYYIEKEKMFYGSMFYLFKGRMVGGDTMSFNEEQIKTELKNIREIWNGTFPKNLD